MAYIRVCTVLLLLAAFAACNSGSRSEAIDTAAEAVAIAQLETEWSGMYGARDLEGVAAMLAQETVLIMPGSDPVVGAANIRAATREMLQSGTEVSWVSDFASVAPSGDMAYDYGTSTTKLADGSIVKGHYLVVWVKEQGEWKVAADIFN